MPIAESGTPEQRQRSLRGVIAGDTITTAALVDAAGPPGSPGSAGTVRGAKTCVPAGMVADYAVVATDDGVAVADLNGPGVTRTRLTTTAGQYEARIEFTDAPMERLGGGASAIDWLTERVTAAFCSTMVG